MVGHVKFKYGVESLLALYERYIGTCGSRHINKLSLVPLQSLLLPSLPCTLHHCNYCDDHEH
jgi:hypothetical protein